MSKTGVIGAIVIIGVGAAGGGGYYYLSQQAEQKFQEKISLIKSSFPDATLTYENHHISLFSQEATMDKVVFKSKHGKTYTADKVVAGLKSGNIISKLDIDKLSIKSHSYNVMVDHIDLEDAHADAGWIVIENGKIKKLFPSKVSFGLLNVNNYEENNNEDDLKVKLAQYQIKNYGLGRKTDITFKDLSITGKDKEMKVGSFQIDQVNQADFSKDIEETLQKFKKTDDSEGFAKNILQNLSMLQFNLLNFQNFQVSKKNDFSFKIAQYELKNYGLNRLTSQSLKDLSIIKFDSDDSVTLKVASVDSGSVDIATMFQLVQTLNFDDLLHHNDFYTFYNSVAQIQKKFIEKVGELKTETKISGVKFHNEESELSLGSISSNVLLNKTGRYEETYTLDNLQFTPLQHNHYTEILNDLGYKTISISGVLKGHYDNNTNALVVSLEHLSFKDMGKISANFKMNIPLALIYSNPEEALRSSKITFNSFALRAQSTGLVENLVDYFAKEQGKTKEQIKTLWVTEFKESIGSNLPFLEDQAQEAMEKFLQDPKTTGVEFASKPTKPISAVSIQRQSSDEISKVLNLSIQAVPVK